MAEVNKVGAGEFIWLLLSKTTGRPVEGCAHTSEERARGTAAMLEEEQPDLGTYEVVAVEIEW